MTDKTPTSTPSALKRWYNYISGTSTVEETNKKQKISESTAVATNANNTANSNATLNAKASNTSNASSVNDISANGGDASLTMTTPLKFSTGIPSGASLSAGRALFSAGSSSRRTPMMSATLRGSATSVKKPRKFLSPTYKSPYRCSTSSVVYKPRVPITATTNVYRSKLLSASATKTINIEKGKTPLLDDDLIQGIIVKKKISEQKEIIERRPVPPQPSITTTSPAMTSRPKVATSPTALKSPRSLQFKAQIASPTGSVTNTVTYIHDESIIKGKLSPSEISQNNVRAFARDDEDLEFNEVEDDLTIPDFAYDEIEEEEATDDTIKSLPFSFMPIQKDTPDISTKKSLKPLRTETESVHKEESIHKEETAKESSKMPPPSSSTSSGSGWGNLFSGMKKQWKCEKCTCPNPDSTNKCLACEAERQSSTSTPPPSTSVDSEKSKPSITFGAPPSKLTSSGFTFGAPVGSAPAPAPSSVPFSFGVSKGETKTESNSDNIVKPPTSTIGGFTFGSTISKTPVPASSAPFSFGADKTKDDKKSSDSDSAQPFITRGGFTFGASAANATASTHSAPFTLGASTDKTKIESKLLINGKDEKGSDGSVIFGSIKSTRKSAEDISTPGASLTGAMKPTFSFGTSTVSSEEINKPTKRKKDTTVEVNKGQSGSVPSFTFGSTSSSTNADTPTPSSAFTFGGTSKPSSEKEILKEVDKKSTSIQSFGTKTDAKSGSSGFGNQISAPASLNPFGASTSSTSPPPPSISASAPPTSKPEQSSTASSIGFGANSLSSTVPAPAPTPSFSFGSTPAPATSSISFSFGTKPTAPLSDSTSPPPPSFSALAPSASNAAQSSTSNSTGFGGDSLNSMTSAPAPSFSFGTTLAPGPTKPSSNFSFDAQSAAPFGASAAPAAAFGGAPVGLTPAFGAPATATTSFGGATSSTSAFGASASKAPTFGGATSSTPTFGSSASTAPTFGVGTLTTPTFGASTSTAPSFGAPTSSAPSFGFNAGPAQSSSGFGTAPAPQVNPGFSSSTSSFSLGTASTTPGARKPTRKFIRAKRPPKNP